MHCILQRFWRNLWTGDRPLVRPLPPQVNVNTERYGGGGNNIQGTDLFASFVLSLPSQDVQKMSPGCILSAMQDAQVSITLAGYSFWLLLFDMPRVLARVTGVRTLLQHDKVESMRGHICAPSGIWTNDLSVWMVEENGWPLRVALWRCHLVLRCILFL
jgi:hypothetical protein